ncbi:AI-2E family transporter [Geobacter sp. AOG1]|uniref:AI-2E family transporter n=1 Tax=Geobacter sp. AOG1 TaxID=1566346 RepID=UPI001CC7F3C0|nr:AI-2E family transporter [Geobacter sp. AOG1]GFE56180.1 AI-2E family transporter [Geobacter sp. AOG1]
MKPAQPAVIRNLLLLMLAVILIAAGYALRHTVSCFLLSFVLAYLLDPLLVYLERNRVRRIYGITILYIILAVFSVIFFMFFVPFLTLRWQSLLHDFPGYLQKIQLLAQGWKSQLLPSAAAEEWRWLVESATEHIDKLLGKIGGGIYAALTRMVFNLFNLVLAPVLVLFMLFYKQTIMDGITSWLPVRRRETLLALGREINGSIGGYIRGQFVVSAIVAVLSSIALFALDVDYALFNGIFAGLASILPFIGVILATLPALFFAYVKFQSGIAMLNVIAAFSVIYFLEGYVIKPLVFKEAMNLNPLVTVIVVMAFGELMGFWGILLAIPIAAACKIVAQYIRQGKFAEEG